MECLKISVIVPIYNTAVYLPRCIESIVKQTYRNIEIILVDDGSTDDSTRICENYAEKDSRIILVRQENRGNNAARKAGLRRSTGAYVMFVDSDDRIGSNLVSLLYRQVEEHGVDLVISNVRMIRVGGREEARRNLIAPGVYTNLKDAVKKLFYDYEECRYGILPYLFAKLYRRDLLLCSMEKIDDRIQYDEDRALVWTCLMQEITAAFIDNMEYDYCQRADGLVRAQDDMYLAKMNYFYCYMKGLFEHEDEILRRQLEQYVICNVQIAFKWKMGMLENTLSENAPTEIFIAESTASERILPDRKEKYRSNSTADSIKVSVIIPSLNAAPYIRQCLDSVRIQTLSEMEILCVDAGSTDGTVEIIEEYTALDKRIRFFSSDQKSYGYQMNLGISKAKGEYIGIVEPDDYVSEEMFEKLYTAANGSSGGKLDYVKADFYKFIDFLGRRHYQKWKRSYWGKSGEVYNRIICLKETPHALVYGDHGNIWSGIYRREFLLDRKIRFHETPGASYQDTGFALLCTLEAERVMFLEDCLYRYRQGGTDASVQSQEKHSTIIAEYVWVWEQMKSRGFTDEVSRSFYMAMKFHSYLWNYNRLQPEGRKYFLENLAKDEILAFKEETIGFHIPEKDRMFRLWQGNWKEADLCNEDAKNRRRHARELLSLLEKAVQIVVVSAGEWGAAFLKLCGKLGAGKICAVCDNSSAVQGKSVEDMYVVSVASAVRKYPDAYFVIANKNHGQELYDQLVGLGVVPGKIYVCSEQPYTKKYDIYSLIQYR